MMPTSGCFAAAPSAAAATTSSSTNTTTTLRTKKKKMMSMTRTNTNSSRAYHWLGRLKHTMSDITIISLLAAAGEDGDAQPPPFRIFDTNLENSPPVFSWNLVAIGYINLDLQVRPHQQTKLQTATITIV